VTGEEAFEAWNHGDKPTDKETALILTEKWAIYVAAKDVLDVCIDEDGTPKGYFHGSCKTMSNKKRIEDINKHIGGEEKND